MLNNLYDNIINGRGRLNRENSMGMGVHTLGTRLQKNVLSKTQFNISPGAIDVMFLYLFHD